MLKHNNPINYLVNLVILLFLLTTNVYAFDSSDKTDDPIRLVQNGGYLSFESSNEIHFQEQKTAETLANLPKQYDLRDVNGKSYVTPPEMQNPWGCCWAFGALSAAESNSIMNGALNTTNFSKRALTWYSFQLQGAKGTPNSDYEGMYFTSEEIPDDKIPFNAGGNSATTVSELSTWNAASTTKEIPYQNNQGTIIDYQFGYPIYSPYGTWSLPYNDIYDNAFHLKGSESINTYRNYSTDSVNWYTQSAKKKLMENGALELGFGMYDDTNYFNESTYSQYVSTPSNPNHDVSIVGWDDNYPVTAFNPKNRPPKPGAWICKNNWSQGWGNDGYFYLSYYDQTIIDFTCYNIETENSTGYNYDQVNQYDYVANKSDLCRSMNEALLSNFVGTEVNLNDYKVANVFENKSTSLLQAVSAYPLIGNAEINIQVYLLNSDFSNPEDGIMVINQTENVENTGYYTFDLENPIYLASGQKYAVIESIIYKDVSINDSAVQDFPGFPIEFGYKDPYEMKIYGPNSANLYPCLFHLQVNVEPNTSYIYGLSTEPSWQDMSNEEVSQTFNRMVNNSSSKLSYVPGNAMIKSFTSKPDSSYIPTSSISVNNGIETAYLATADGATNSIDLTATLNPSNSSDPIVWSIEDGEIASLSNINGSTTTLTALEEGNTVVTVNAGPVTTTINVIVSNSQVVASEAIISATQPDYYTATLKDVIANPAVGATGEVQKVSIFNWSAVENGVQIDMNAKVAERIPGTNDWQWENFPVNGNEVNNYFINAENIQINVYGSLDPNSEGCLLAAGDYYWINQDTAHNQVLGYIGYSQNIGFDRPTVFNGMTAGTVGQGLSLEGFRISPNSSELDIATRVHVKDLGWLETVGSGTYAGTMHQNLPIEAIELTLTGENASLYSLQYRVHQRNLGWQDWVSSGQTAGSTGQSIPIEAIEVRLTENN